MLLHRLSVDLKRRASDARDGFTASPRCFPRHCILSLASEKGREIDQFIDFPHFHRRRRSHTVLYIIAS
jgi:hypothetical protein